MITFENKYGMLLSCNYERYYYVFEGFAKEDTDSGSNGVDIWYEHPKLGARNSGYPLVPAGRGYIKLLARAVRVAHFMRLAVD